MKIQILIVTTSSWVTTARLAMAMANAGCVVDAICPARHPVRKTSALRNTYDFRGLSPLNSIAKAIAHTNPDLIVPGDDLATLHLHRLHEREGGYGEVADVIERSLGSPESFPVLYARTRFIELAIEAGIRAPKTSVIANPESLKQWISRTGFPVVLKANGTSGGDGVRVAHSFEDASHALRQLQAPPRWARAVKRALIDQDKTLLWPALMGQRYVVNAQEFVDGREATSAVACWEGQVLADLHFEVLQKRDAAGPSSVLRRIENADMKSATEKMARRLNLSGLHGFDFMLESDTGNAYLIEINPRATQVGHLALGPGRDLPAALCGAVSGQRCQAAPQVTENDVIALFQQEWMRDPESPFLRSAYHDVPWEERELLRACVRLSQKKSAGRSEQELMQTLSAVRAPRS